MTKNVMTDFKANLLQVLLRIPALESREGRNILINDLPNMNTINRYDSPMTDLQSMVTAVMQLGRIANTNEFAIEDFIRKAQSLVNGYELENELDQLLKK
jgi:hypothetical protein